MFRTKFFMEDIDQLCHISEPRKEELLDISLLINGKVLPILDMHEYQKELDKEHLERHEYIWLVMHYADLLIRSFKNDPEFCYGDIYDATPHV